MAEITHEHFQPVSYHSRAVFFVSHEPNMRVKRKIPQGMNRYLCFFVNLDVSCTVGGRKEG